MRYLVTGGHGKLGKELCPLLDCIAPTHTEMDMLAPLDIERYVTSEDVDEIVHLAAITSRAYADQHKAQSYECNVIGTRNIASIAKKYNKKVFYISTEIVFPGSHGNYQETDVPNPRDWYAFTKYAGELEIQRSETPHLIIRTTFRPHPWGFPTAYINVHTTGDYTDIIAQEIAQCMTINPNGIIHVGTPMKTWYELAQRRNPDVQPEEFPDPMFLRRDLNIERWLDLKKKLHA